MARMLTHKIFFDGKVQSVGFERNGRRQSAGVIDVGEFHFGTDAPERMPGRDVLRGGRQERLRREGDRGLRLPLRVPVVPARPA